MVLFARFDSLTKAEAFVREMLADGVPAELLGWAVNHWRVQLVLT